MFCPNCGAKLTEGANFCAKCGQKSTQRTLPTGDAEQPQPMPQETDQLVGESQQAAPKPASAVTKLDEGGWARVVMSLGMLGLLFIAFTRFGGPSPALSLGHLINRTIGYGTTPPVLGILFGGVMIGVGFVFRERIKGVLSEMEILLIGGGVAVASVLMMMTPGFHGEIGRFIFLFLIGAVLLLVGLTILRTTGRFTENKVEIISGRFVAFSLVVFAVFTVISGVGILLDSSTLSYDLPNVFLIISGIAGLLGVLGFAGSTVLRILRV